MTTTSKVDCAFCPKPEKRTEWYEETDEAILMEKLGGGPMVVLKRHTTDPTKDELDHCKELASRHFENPEFRVLMAVVTDHWHAHVLKGQDLSDE